MHSNNYIKEGLKKAHFRKKRSCTLPKTKKKSPIKENKK